MLAFQKKKVNKEELTEIIAVIYTAHGLPVPASFKCKSAASAVAGVVEIDGITWPVWKAHYSARPSVIWVTELTGKLDLFPGITTHCGLNRFCVERMKNGNLICAACFAEKTLARYDGADEHAAINTLLLAFHRVPADLVPLFLNSIKARLEPFGDLQTTLQAENYFTIIDANPQTRFGWWTKNPGFIKTVLATRQRPKNVSFILSEIFMDGGQQQPTMEMIKAVFPFIDHRFTVYEPTTIKARGIAINCGARCCGSCGLCYGRFGSFEVREQ
ncbi:MAG: hypothetical protein J6T26_04790 [Firmicutes bacterium]|nr:hypothetical protein [Bacillota bacterium]